MSPTSVQPGHRRPILISIVLAIVLATGVAVWVTAGDDETSVPDGTAPPTAGASSVVETVVTTVPDTRYAAPQDALLPAALVDFFPIGVDFQPTENFELWKERGINTVIRAPDGVDVDEWADAADAAGLYQVRPARSEATADVGNPLLLAWSHRDEPDFNPRQIPAAEIQAQYDAWKAIDPNRPVLVNISGDMESTDLATGESGEDFYRPYFAAADWISGDIYPSNRNEPLTWVGRMVDEIEGIADGKPVFAYIEASDFDIDDYNTSVRSGAPTPDELRGEVWHAIIHGARGIWYFPERVSPTFGYDDTPDDVAAAMPELHARITGLASVLQGPIDPPGIAATVAAPLEVTWRDTSSGTYFIVLNMSDESRPAQTITLESVGSATTAEVYEEDRSVSIADGAITDDFEPYAVHIYRIP